MDERLQQFKTWFEKRNLREKLWVTGLSFAILYAVFSLILFRPVDTRYAELSQQLKTASDNAKNWQTQLQYLTEIPKSNTYKEWVKEHNNYLMLKDKYKNLIGKSGSEKWDEIIKTVLSEYPNITIEKIENRPETVFETSKIQSQPDSIYQQQMRVTVRGDYNDIVNYLTSLETALPSIHWDALDYTVTEYPLAQVGMEFSIIYEKSNT